MVTGGVVRGEGRVRQLVPGRSAEVRFGKTGGVW